MPEENSKPFGDPAHPNRPYPWPPPPEDPIPGKAADLIDLSAPRLIVIRQGARKFDYTVPRIPQERWFEYFDGIVSTAERKGKQVVQHTDASSAGVELVEKVVIQDEAAQRMPLAHRLAVANVLTSAYVPDQDMQGFGQVPLVAIWSAGNGGTMRRYKNLVHSFEEPTAEQNRRYRREDSRAQIVGGSRKGTTVYHGAQRALAALYDELIVSVEGYAVGDTPIAGREMIASHMDTFHKVASVVRLFAPQEIEIEDEDEE